MNKLKKTLSAVLAASMFISNAAYAGELVDTENVSANFSSTIAYNVDKIKNSVKNLFSSDSSNDILAEDNTGTEFQDPGMELDSKDIQALYDMGYELTDIEEAIELSSIYEKTPYELLQLKGKTQYIPQEVSTPEDTRNVQLYSVDDKNGETEISESQKDYEFTAEETSWNSVVTELNGTEVSIDDNQWEFIKLSGIDQYIDESMLSDEDKAQLETVGTSAASKSVSARAASSSSTDIVDI